MDAEAMRKELHASQMKLGELASQYKSLLLEEIPAKEYAIRRATLTASEVATLPELNPVYKMVGKAYFRSSKPEIMESLGKAKENEEEILAKLRHKKMVIENAVNQIEAQQSVMREKLLGGA